VEGLWKTGGSRGDKREIILVITRGETGAFAVANCTGCLWATGSVSV
jgi:hypothetical protein